MAAYRTGITHMQPVTIDMAYAVLVDGRKQVDVAKEFDRSKQTVNAAIRRVTAIFNEVIPEDEQLEFVQSLVAARAGEAG